MLSRTELLPLVVLLSLAGGAHAAEPAAGDPAPYLGEPYVIDKVPYHPAETGMTDETGYAGVIPDSRSGIQTVLGEVYASDAVVAAHKTLPLPSYAEVTALATGRTIVVRVSDRGPLANDRIIDLSCGAARQLGLAGSMPVAVRVRRVNPPEPERGALRSGQAVAERLATPEPLLAVLRKRLPMAPRSGLGPAEACGVAETSPVPAAPKTVAVPAKPTPVPPASPPKPVASPVAVASTAPVAKPAPPPSRTTDDDGFIIEHGDGGKSVPTTVRRSEAVPAPVKPQSSPYAVQVAALTDSSAAAALARRLGGHVERSGRLSRVRLGPYADESAARRALARVHAKGYPAARLVRND